MCKKNYSKIIAMLNNIIYAIFVIAEIIAVLSVALGIISLIYRIVMSHSMCFLYGAKGNIFAVSVIVMIAAAALSNILDKRNK